MGGQRGSSGWSLRGAELFGGVLVLIGIVFFLGNANLVHVSWNLIWPILIVAAGAAMVLSAMRPRADLPGSVDVPREGVDQLELDLSLGAGTFRIHGGATNLVEVRSSRQDIVRRLDRSGSRGRVRLSQDVHWFPFGAPMGADWEVRAASDVPTALSLNGGAGRFDLDLSELRIVDARMSVGAAEARVTLPHPVGEVAFRISSGAASLTIQVPAGVEARVGASGGLLQISGRTETPNYAAARDRVNVSVSGGASSVKVV